jgi:hypothetical protein
MAEFSFYLQDDAATIRFGEDLALVVRQGDCIALSGDLGAGKSALSRALIRAIAGDADLEVPSPTFTLVQTYDLRIPVSHFDLYRLADESELQELGLTEALESQVVLVEWPERAGDCLPADTIRIAIAIEGSGRRLTISCPEGRFLSRFIRVRAIRDFLERHGHMGARRHFLTGDSSFRAYERIYEDQKPVRILMDSPARSNGPPIRDGKPYSQLVHLAENVKPFVAIGRYLKDIGLSAPDIYDMDLDQGILLIEDLGSGGVLDQNGHPIAERYEEAVRCLAGFHGRKPPQYLPVSGDITHQVPAFDRAALKYEVEVFLDWHIPWRRGAGISDGEKADYLAIWDHLIDELQSAETNLVLRDYHSPNLLWLPERRGFDRIGIIDFQDAIIGPTSYDVVSLSQDARVTVERPLLERLVEIYMTTREAQGSFNRPAFLKSYAIMSAQRACRLNGLWVRLKDRDHMPGYMRHMPRTLWHLSMALEHPVNAPLRDWFIKAGIPLSESLETA